MKKILLMLVVVLTMGTLLTSCEEDGVAFEDNPKHDSKLGEVLRGQHNLKEFKDKSYFHYNESGDIITTFQLKDGSYMYIRIPMNKVRIKIIAASDPYVKFRWCRMNSTDIEWAMKMDKIKYVVIHTNDDIAPQIYTGDKLKKTEEVIVEQTDDW